MPVHSAERYPAFESSTITLPTKFVLRISGASSQPKRWTFSTIETGTYAKTGTNASITIAPGVAQQSSILGITCGKHETWSARIAARKWKCIHWTNGFIAGCSCSSRCRCSSSQCQLTSSEFTASWVGKKFA